MLLLTFTLVLSEGCFSQATQLIFPNALPNYAGKGLAVYLDVCAADGLSVVDMGYSNPISITNNGGVPFVLDPPNGSNAIDGCLRFRIIPLDTGYLHVMIQATGLSSLNSGLIRVDSFAIPITSYVGEIFYPGNTPSTLSQYQAWADTLNDKWEGRIAKTCHDSVPSSFDPVYGELVFDPTTYVGEIQNLEVLEEDTIASYPYQAVVTFQMVNIKEPPFAGVKGEHHTSGSYIISSPQVLQDSAPMPFSLIPTNNQRFTEFTGDPQSRNGLLFHFSQPASQFGMWIGDVESNPLLTPAEVILFHGDVELKRDTIPTQSSLIQQSNSPFNCGSYPGCGNQGTLWMEFYGAKVTDLLLVVGDDNSSGFWGYGGTEHLSFTGATMGGHCLIEPAETRFMSLELIYEGKQALLRWENQSPSTKYSYVELAGEGFSFQKIGKLVHKGMISRFLLPAGVEGKKYARIREIGQEGESFLSEWLEINLRSEERIRLILDKGMLHILLPKELSLPHQIEWIDIQGRTIKQALLNPKREQDFDISLLPFGLYIIRIKGPERNHHIKWLYQP